MGGHDIEAAAFVRFDPPRRVRSGASPPVGAAVSTPPYHYRKWPHLGLIRNSNNGMTVNTFAILSCANRRHADRTTAAPPVHFQRIQLCSVYFDSFHSGLLIRRLTGSSLCALIYTFDGPATRGRICGDKLLNRPISRNARFEQILSPAHR